MSIEQTLPSDINKYLFVIHPEISIFYHKEYKKVYHQLINLRRTNSRNLKLDSLADRISQLRVQVDKEIEENNNLIKESMGRPVKYNEPIFIMNYSTKAYLLIRNNQDSERSESKYTCECDFYLSKAMLFKFTLFRSSDSSDPFVYYDNKISIENVKHKVFLSGDNIVTDSLLKIESVQHLDSINNLKNNFDTTSDKNHTSKLLTDVIEDFNWSFLQFRLYSNERDLEVLKFANVISLQNNDNGLYLNASMCQEQNQDIVSLSRYDGKISEESISLNSIWIVEDIFKSHGDFIDAEFDPILGLNRSKACYLKHFLSGKYISLDDNKKCTLVTANSQIEPCRFHFYPIKKNSQRITNNSSCLIEISGKFFKPVNLKTDQLVTEPKKDAENIEFVKKNSHNFQKASNIKPNNYRSMFRKIYDELVYQPILTSERKKQKFSINIRDAYSIDDTYLVRILPGIDLDALYFMDSLRVKFKGILLNLEDDLMTYESQNNEIIDILNSLRLFVRGKYHSKRYFYFEQITRLLPSEPPLEKFQKMIREFGIIDFFIFLILKNFTNFDTNYIHNENENNELSLSTIFYECLADIVVGYSPNELYLAQWLVCIQNYCLKVKSDSQFNDRRLLKDLVFKIFNSNKQIVKTKINKSIIENFLSQIHLMNFEYIDILKSILKYENQPIVNNQGLLADLIFNNPSNFTNFIYQIRETNGEFAIINSTMSEPVLIGDFTNSHIIRFCYILELLTYIFYKNYSHIVTRAKEIYNKTILIKILQRNYSNYHLNENIGNLLKIIWIDTEIKRKQTIPQTIVIWSDISNSKEKLYSSNNDKDSEINFTAIMSFIEKYMAESDLKNTEYLFSVLNIIKKLIKNRIIVNLNFFLKLSLFVKFILINLRFSSNPQYFAATGKRDHFYCSKSSLLKIILKIIAILLNYTIEYKSREILYHISLLQSEKGRKGKHNDSFNRVLESDRQFIAQGDHAVPSEEDEHEIQNDLLEILKSSKKEIKGSIVKSEKILDSEILCFDCLSRSEILQEILQLYPIVPQNLKVLIHKTLLTKLNIDMKIAKSIKMSFFIFHAHDKALYTTLQKLQISNFDNFKRLTQSNNFELTHFREIFKELISIIKFLNQIMLNEKCDLIRKKKTGNAKLAQELDKKGFYDKKALIKVEESSDINREENKKSLIGKDKVSKDLLFYMNIYANVQTFSSREIVKNLDFVSFYIQIFLEKEDSPYSSEIEFKKFISHIVSFFIIACKRDLRIQKNISEYIPHKKFLNLIKAGPFLFENLSFFLAVIIDNSKVLIGQKDLSKSIIERYFDLLRNDEMEPRIVSLVFRTLACFPVCNTNTIISTNQNIIINFIFENFYPHEGNRISLLLKSKLDFMKLLNESPNKLLPNTHFYKKKELKVHNEDMYIFINFVQLLVNAAEKNTEIWTKQLKQFFDLNEVFDVLQSLSQLPLIDAILVKFTIITYINQFFKVLSKVKRYDTQIVICQLVNFFGEEVLKLDNLPFSKFIIFFNGIYNNTKEIVSDYIGMLCNCIAQFLDLRNIANFDNIKSLYLDADVLKRLFQRKAAPETLRVKIQAILLNEAISIPKRQKGGQFIHTLDTQDKNTFNFLHEQTNKTLFSFKLYSMLKSESSIVQNVDHEVFFAIFKNSKFLIVHFIQAITVMLVSDRSHQISPKLVDHTIKIIETLFNKAYELLKNSPLPSSDSINTITTVYMVFLIKTATLYLDNDIMSDAFRMFKIVLDIKIPTNIFLFHKLLASNTRQDIMGLLFKDFLSMFDYISLKFKNSDDTKFISAYSKSNELELSEKSKSYEGILVDKKIKLMEAIISIMIKTTSYPSETIDRTLLEHFSINNYEETFLLQIMKNVIEEFMKYIQPAFYEILIKIFEFLINSVNAFKPNIIDALFELKMVDICRELIENLYWKDLSASDTYSFSKISYQINLAHQCIRFVNQILFYIKDPERINQISSTFKFKYIFSILRTSLEVYLREAYSLEEDKINESHLQLIFNNKRVLVIPYQVQQLFEIFFFIKQVRSISSVFKNKIKNLNGMNLSIFNLFEQNSSRIAINRRGQIEYVYFIIQPMIRNLTKEDKTEMLQSIDRTSSNSKLISFMQEFDYMFFKLKYFAFRVKSRFRSIASNRLYKTLIHVNFIVSIIINIIYFMFEKKVVKNNISYSSLESGSESDSTQILKYILAFLKYFFLFISIISFISWCFRYTKVTLTKAWAGKYKQFEQELKLIPSLTSEQEKILVYLKNGEFDLFSDLHYSVIRSFYSIQQENYRYMRFVNWLLNFKFMFSSKVFMHHFVLLYFAIFALCVNAPLFFCICLNVSLIVR
jgi:hypothetical protein